jgi:hypothetical protein
MKYIKLFETFINIDELDITQEEINLILKEYIDIALKDSNFELQEELMEIKWHKYDSEIESGIESDEPEDEETVFTIEDINNDSLIDAYNDIKNFIELAGKESIEYYIRDIQYINGFTDFDKKRGLEFLGYDIWYARNNEVNSDIYHLNDESMVKKLLEAAKKIGSKKLKVGEDMKLYFT